MNIGERLLLERRKRGLTQAEVARLAGVSQGHVSNMERGVTADYETAKVIFEAWEVDFVGLLREEVGLATSVETQIESDPSLRADDRSLLLQIYRIMRERGPFGPAIGQGG